MPTTALGLAPVNLHRVLFRKHPRRPSSPFGHVLLRIILVGVGIVLTGAVLFIFDVVLDRTAAVIAAALVALVLAVIAALPHILSRTRAAEFRADDHSGKGAEACRVGNRQNPASGTAKCLLILAAGQLQHVDDEVAVVVLYERGASPVARGPRQPPPARVRR